MTHGKLVLWGYIIACRTLLSIRTRKEKECTSFALFTCKTHGKSLCWLANPYQQNFAFSYWFCQWENLSRSFLKIMSNARFCRQPLGPEQDHCDYCVAAAATAKLCLSLSCFIHLTGVAICQSSEKLDWWLFSGITRERVFLVSNSYLTAEIRICIENSTL